jgi:formamidopyrimidine-DNA glycosylase
MIRDIASGAAAVAFPAFSAACLGPTRGPKMPELPDLTVFAESLSELVLNKEIRDAVYHKKKRLNVDPEEFADLLRKRKIVKLSREGKALLFELDNGESFLVHLMLSGGFRVCPKNEEVPSAILTVTFVNEQSMVLFDPRGLATVTAHPKLERTAVDALELTRDHLAGLFKERKELTVKELLIDQKVITGIGNAYSDEILYYARISPKSIVGKIPEKALSQLVSAIPHVLKTATDYLRKNHPGIMSGEVRDHLAVHRPKAKLSPSGSAIMSEQIAKKKTYYTDEQVLYR